MEPVSWALFVSHPCKQSPRIIRKNHYEAFYNAGHEVMGEKENQND